MRRLLQKLFRFSSIALAVIALTFMFNMLLVRVFSGALDRSMMLVPVFAVDVLCLLFISLTLASTIAWTVLTLVVRRKKRLDSRTAGGA